MILILDNHDVILGSKDDLRTRDIYIRDVNWIGDDDISQIESKKIKIKAKIRSTQEPKLANLFLSNQRLCINFTKMWKVFPLVKHVFSMMQIIHQESLGEGG